MNRFAIIAGAVASCFLVSAAAAQTAPNFKSATVSVPLEDLRGLLEKPQPVKAPVDYVFGPTTVDFHADGKTASVSTSMDVTILSDGWVQLPLGPSAGVRAVEIDKKPASLIQRGGTVYALLNGKNGTTVKVEMTAEKKLIADGPLTKLELTMPPAALVEFGGDIKRGNQDVKVSGGAGAKVTATDQKTSVSAVLQGDQTATVTWRAKPAAGVQVNAKIIPRTLTRVAVGRGVVRYLAQIHYDIPQGEIDTFKIALPEGVEFTSATGNQVRDTQIVTAEDKSRTLVVTLAEPARDAYALQVLYEMRFDEKQPPAVALLKHPDLPADTGSIGLEVRSGGYELVPTAAGAQRVDVRELPEGLWSSAKSPLLFGYRYDTPKDVKISLGLTKHAEVDVLVAMSDVAEAATTITSDGKEITKVMYVTRNNLKQFMTLKLPEGAQLWSAFVDDRPVTPVKSAKGEILIPLKKSEASDPDDDASYRALREKRRAETDEDRRNRAQKPRRALDENEPADLKPYDVEIVFVRPASKIQDKGQLNLALPQSDIPIGKISWAVFHPGSVRIVDAQGNMSEVDRFTLGFRHFADVALAKVQELQKQQAMAQAEQIQKALDKLVGEKAKAEGVLPVRVEIPVSGDITRYEKLLTVDETPAMTLTYRKKAD